MIIINFVFTLIKPLIPVIPESKKREPKVYNKYFIRKKRKLQPLIPAVKLFLSYDLFGKILIYENTKFNIKRNLAVQLLPKFLNPYQPREDIEKFTSSTPLGATPDILPKRDIIMYMI